MDCLSKRKKGAEFLFINVCKKNTREKKAVSKGKLKVKIKQCFKFEKVIEKKIEDGRNKVISDDLKILII